MKIQGQKHSLQWQMLREELDTLLELQGQVTFNIPIYTHYFQNCILTEKIHHNGE